MKKQKTKQVLDPGASERHDTAQSLPHPLEGTRALPIRVPIDKRGELIAQFFLPLTLAQPRNRSRGLRQKWQWASDRKNVFDAMQNGIMWHKSNAPIPLPGRPVICCIRYSSTSPDSTSGWSKVPVDCLQPGGVRITTSTVTAPDGKTHKIQREKPFKGLGIIASDSPQHAEVYEWWEPAKRGEGFCVIEVWSGVHQ